MNQMTAGVGKWNVSWLLGRSSFPRSIPDPAVVAVRSPQEDVTYAQLRERALGLAASLQALGIRPGARVAGHLLNRVEVFELYFACAYLGATYVPLSFRLAAPEIAHVLDDSGSEVVFTQVELADTLTEATGLQQNPPRVVVLGDAGPGEAYEQLRSASADELETHRTEHQIILYTSGTTGRPKGVMLGHEQVLSFALQQVVEYTGLRRGATTMLIGPLFNTAAINEYSIPTLLVGGTVAIMPSRGWSADRMLELVGQWEVTVTSVFPSMMKAVLEAAGPEDGRLDTVEFVLTGGEQCPPELMDAFMRRWPDLEFLIAYGATECGVATTISRADIRQKPGSVGRPWSTMAVEVRDDAGQPLRENETGNIWIAGPSVTPGYWNAPELTDASIQASWFKIGDLGYFDADGYLYIRGRSKDMIISKGQNIYAAEIESALQHLPDIQDVAIIAVPDEEFGEVVWACVVPSAGEPIDLDGITSYTVKHLASYKKPRGLTLMDSIPRNPAGKADKDTLKKLVIERRRDSK